MLKCFNTKVEMIRIQVNIVHCWFQRHVVYGTGKLTQFLFHSQLLFYCKYFNLKTKNTISKQHSFTIRRKSFFYYIFRLNLPAESTMPLSENDKRKANQLLNLPYIQHHQLWLNEVNFLFCLIESIRNAVLKIFPRKSRMNKITGKVLNSAIIL